MRHLLVALSLLLVQLPAAQAQISVNIGINLPVYPQLQRVPGYPVYYAPQTPGNFFFYDGLYWVFEDDGWYFSSWYNGPWRYMEPLYVPVYLLRVPVRYYRSPPAYFTYWRDDAPPRWSERWGRDWEQRRPGWDRWDRRTAPAPAPLPDYQRNYPQSRYPKAQQQDDIRVEKYRYDPREPVVRQQLGQQPQRGTPRPQEREETRRPERQEPGERPEQVERPAQRIERAEPRPLERAAPRQERRAEPEQRRPEQRAAPEPRAQQPPQRQPQARPEPQPGQQQPRAQESGRGPDRNTGPRRGDEEERGRGSNRN